MYPVLVVPVYEGLEGIYGASICEDRRLVCFINKGGTEVDLTVSGGLGYHQLSIMDSKALYVVFLGNQGSQVYAIELLGLGDIG